MGLRLGCRYYTCEEVLAEFSKNEPIGLVIDCPKGSLKGFGDQNNLVSLPFDYGELPLFKNKCDNMGWDVIIVPHSDPADSLKPVGVAIVNTDLDEWKRRIPNSKKLLEENPVGNDKIILAKEGKVTNEDRELLEEFCSRLWQFERIDWL